MEELAPISASLGAMGSLAEKLRDTELKDEMGKLKTRLYHLSKTWDPPLAASRWMNDVRGLSYEMENCVDTETDWIHKIKRFKARLKDSNGRYDRYDLEGVLSHTNNTDPMIVGHRLPTVHGGREPDPVVGLDAAVGRLCRVLTDGDEQLKVLSIVGVGGIGKTTLVKQLWRKHKPGDYFRCRAFVRTAKEPDMRRILRSILAQVRPHQQPQANEVQELIDDISEHLQDKRYFVIIDDLWDTSVWDVARRAFPEGNGSRILTTTEIEDVALACCTYQFKYVFNMEPLIDSHSKELFTGAVFGYGEQTSPQLDKVSDEIIRRCAGLPLAIISISSVLASQGEINTVHNMEKIVNILPTNTTPEDIIKQVLNFCYNCLPSNLQTCLLYLSLYPENYMILKEDIVKQWVAEGFILAPTEKDKLEVAGSYFEKLVSMGLIQHIDVDYSDEVLYYAVHHTVHDVITSKSTEHNFITAIDYSQRTSRFSNKVSRLSLQFGSATYATKPDSIGLSQVRSLAFIGLKSCFPPISEFMVLRSLILHVWADQQISSIDLKPTSELVMLRSLQVTFNGTVHLPDLMQGLKHLETLEINAVVADIPASIVHLRSWLHLRLGVGTELPDVTGIIKNATLNRPISLNESSSPPNLVMTIELLLPICSIPKWIGQLTNLCSLKIVARELDDISSLQGLPSLTVLSLHIQRRIIEVVGFATGAFVALKYFDFRCGVLRLIFHKGTMPNLQRLKLGFNAHRGEQYGCSLVGIEDLLSVQKISGIIGVPMDVKEYDYDASVSAFKKAIGKHYSKVSIKRADMFEEEFDPPEEQHQHPPTSSEQPEIQPQGSQENTRQNADSDTQSINSFQEKLTNMGAENQLLRQQALLHSPMRTISESTSPKSNLTNGSPRSEEQMTPHGTPRAPKDYGNFGEPRASFSEKQHESVDALINCVTENIGFSEGKPIAAITIYKCLVHWKIFETEKTSVFDRLIQIFGSAMQYHDSNEDLAYWLSNSSTLLIILQKSLRAVGSSGNTPQKRPQTQSSFLGRMVFRSSTITIDMDLVRQIEAKYPAFLFKQQLTAFVEGLYGMIRDNVKKELSALLLHAIQVPRIMKGVRGRSFASSSLRGRSFSNQGSYWQAIVDNLTELLNILRANCVPAIFIRKIFTQIFSFINAQLFNSLLVRHECCSFSNGEYVKQGLAKLEMWCGEVKPEYAGSALDELTHIRQAVGFLVIFKKFRISYDEIVNDLCPVLSVQQLYKICTQYWDEKYNTESVSEEVLDEMRTLMTEELAHKTSESTFLLDEEISMPISLEEIADSMDVKEFQNVAPPLELVAIPSFQFLKS